MKQERNTLQKEVTYNTLLSLGCHPTAEEVYERVHESYPTISKATVYRNLAVLEEKGCIRRIPKLGSGSDRYDHNMMPHYHAKCTRCGRIFDVVLENQDNLLKMAKVKDEGFAISTYNLVFEGLCEKCRAKEINKNGTQGI